MHRTLKGTHLCDAGWLCQTSTWHLQSEAKQQHINYDLQELSSQRMRLRNFMVFAD